MKALFVKMLPLMGLALFFVACEEALPMYETEQDCLNFTVALREDYPTPVRKTFVYDPENVVRDTIYVPVTSMGFVRDYDRPITFEQVIVKPDSVYNAEPGVHYVPFDDPEVKDLMVLPAGQASVDVPIIVLRDTTLRDTVTVLQLRIAPNDYFELGDRDRAECLVEIGEQLMQPKNWMLFGTYGYEKHRFLIEMTGWRFDEETFEELMADYLYASSIRTQAIAELKRVNAEREARGEGPLCEADGTPVKF